MMHSCMLFLLPPPVFCFYFSDCSLPPPNPHRPPTAPASFAGSCSSIYFPSVNTPQGPVLTSVPFAGFLFYPCRLGSEPTATPVSLSAIYPELQTTSNSLLDMDASQVPRVERVPAYLLRLNCHQTCFSDSVNGSSINKLSSQKLPLMIPFPLPKGVYQASCPHSLVWFIWSLVNWLVAFLSSCSSTPYHTS